MPGWLSIRAVQKLSGTLARAEERDFERKALPCLRLRWPIMQQAPATASWDRKGIDLFTWEEEGPFTCVVQCKGFRERELGLKQIQQVEESIDSFRQSHEKAKTFIL